MLATGSDENFKWAYELAYERAYGKSVSPIEVNDISDQRPTREQLESAIARLSAIADGVKLDQGK